ncbi:MAG: hypothetical protein KDJ80_07400 [Nitratireductor sp.]|nr:hypothetical protein [Nitratireductor sp.]
MKKYLIALIPVGLSLALAACSETANESTGPTDQQSMRTGSPQDEQACELAVTQQTNNPDVITLSSDFSQANTEVILGVGQQRARWRCLVSNGQVAEVMSLTDEGSL